MKEEMDHTLKKRSAFTKLVWTEQKRNHAREEGTRRRENEKRGIYKEAKK